MPEQNYAAFHADFLRNRSRLHAGVTALVLSVALARLVGLMHLRQKDEDRTAEPMQHLASSLQQTFDGLMDTIEVALQATGGDVTQEMAAGKLDAPSLTRMMTRRRLYSYRRSPRHGFTMIVGIDADAALALAALTSNRMISRAWQRQNKSIARLEARQGFNEAAQVRHRDARVLVADDQPFNREVVQGMLAVAGIVPKMASNGQDALDNAAPTTELLQNLERDVNAMCAEIDRGPGPEPGAEPLPASPPMSLPPGPPPDSIARLIASLERGHGDCDRLIAECLSELADTAWAPCWRQTLLHVRDYDYAAASSLLAGHRQAQTTGS